MVLDGANDTFTLPSVSSPPLSAASACKKEELVCSPMAISQVGGVAGYQDTPSPEKYTELAAGTRSATGDDEERIVISPSLDSLGSEPVSEVVQSVACVSQISIMGGSIFHFYCFTTF